MRMISFDPAPVVSATGVVTPSGEEVSALAAAAGQAPLRFRRMDRYTTLGFVAATLAIGRRPDEFERDADPTYGIVSGSSLACWGSNAEFLRELARGPVVEASPALFARTVPNAVNGEISIAFRLGGPNQTFVSGWTAGAEALVEAARLIGSRAAATVLAGGIEAPDEALQSLHAQVRGERGMEWLPSRLAEGAAMCVLSDAAAAPPGSLRLKAFARSFDPAGAASLSAALPAHAPPAVYLANTVPPALRARWRTECGGAEVIDLPARAGELGAAAAPAAVALACRDAAARGAESTGALVVARGFAGELVVLALAP